MTDLEMTKLCAEAMGYPEFVNPDSRVRKPVEPCILVLKMDENATRELYDPLHDDAQAMALVKKFELSLAYCRNGSHPTKWFASPSHSQLESTTFADTSLNRAICKCVAKMQATK